MAVSRSNYHDKAFVMGLFSLLLLIQRGGAFEFKVGGSSGWSVPSNNESYNAWAEKNRFQVGDTLLFVYPKETDAVLQVTKENYNNCITETPLAKFTDGHTVFKLNQSGPFYFIGTKEKCQKNEKLEIIVLAERNTSPAQAPSSHHHMHNHTHSPAPAPNSNHTHNHAHPPTNGGSSSIVISVVGLFGFTVGSSLFLGL